MKRNCKRKKAFLGAIIGGVMGIAGSAISAASQRKANEKQIKRENYINRNQSANNLSNAYSNEEYVDDFLNKTTFKYGGNKTMACGNRKTAKMGISDRYKKQLETEAKNRQETKKRLSAKNTKPFPYNSPFVRNYANESYNTPSYVSSAPVRATTNTQKSVAKSTSSANRTTTISTKRPTSSITQIRTAVKRNTNTANNTNRNRPANTSTQRTAKPAAQKTTKLSNVKPATNKATATKTAAKPVRQNADNKLTFSRAFANARRAGKQTFNWNGKSYTTQLAGEKTYKVTPPNFNTTKIDNVNASKELVSKIPSSSSIIPKSSEYYDRINMMKCGGKRKMKCGGKCKRK